MALSTYKADRGFFKFYWEILRVNWIHLLRVFLTFEALSGAILFFVALISKEAAEKTWEFMLDHSLWAISPAFIVTLWVYLVAVHRAKLTVDEGGQPKESLSFSIDHDPKGPGFALLGVRLIIKTNAKDRTIHNVSVILVEYNQLPEKDSLIDHSNEQLYFALNDNGHTIDLDAGQEIRVPFVEFNQEKNSIRVLSCNKCWYGNARGAMYRVKVMVTGENTQPASATFVVGFDRKDIAFFNRVKQATPKNLSNNQP